MERLWRVTWPFLEHIDRQYQCSAFTCILSHVVKYDPRNTIAAIYLVLNPPLLPLPVPTVPVLPDTPPRLPASLPSSLPLPPSIPSPRIPSPSDAASPTRKAFAHQSSKTSGSQTPSSRPLPFPFPFTAVPLPLSAAVYTPSNQSSYACVTDCIAAAASMSRVRASVM